MLTIKALNQFYGLSHTLWDVGLTVPAGSRVCLMGRNGMGKTTLLRCIMGLQPVRSGGIEFEGGDLLKCAAEQRARIELAIAEAEQRRDRAVEVREWLDRLASPPAPPGDPGPAADTVEGEGSGG